jgi:putative membrane protein
MRNWIARWVISAMALAVVTRLDVGVRSSGVQPLLIATLSIGLANSIVRPVLGYLTMPLNCLTFGLFSYVLSFLLFYLVGQIVPGFDVTPKGAIIGSLLMSAVSGVLSHFLTDRRRR